MKQKNQTFQYLKAIAILMVIDDHMSTRIGFLSSLFPYNSFYMPLFVFISGYFFRDKGVGRSLKSKVEHLLLPYLIWIYVGQLVSFMLDRAGVVHWYIPVNNVLNTMNYLLTVGPISLIIGPAWFGIMLFWVVVLYILLHKLLQFEKPLMAYVFLIISIIAGFITLQLCMKGYQNTSLVHMALLRAVWYIQFYHMGWLFHEHWEKKIERVPALAVIGICIFVNVILLCIYGDKINFYSTTYMSSFNSWWIPLITSITGILFWYKVMHFIAERVGEIKAVSFLADNTFTVMCTHLMFTNISNYYAYQQALRGNIEYTSFPTGEFLSSPWVRYNANTRLVGFFCGLIGSLLVAFVIGRLSDLLAKCVVKKEKTS